MGSEAWLAEPGRASMEPNSGTTLNQAVQRLVWCGLLLAAANAFGQKIDVVVLNAKNGREVRNAVVWVQFFEAPANHTIQRIQSKTGPDGVAHVELTAAQPAQLTVSASTDAFCEGYITAATVDIVNHGAVARCDPRPGDSPPTPSPGKVIFFIRRIPWWYRLLAPLETE
jgi:hypothetical protein